MSEGCIDSASYCEVFFVPSIFAVYLHSSYAVLSSPLVLVLNVPLLREAMLVLRLQTSFSGLGLLSTSELLVFS